MPTLEKKLLPNNPVFAVRADASIASCVRIMRDHAVGALVILSDNAREELVGIFTERDLVKQIEVIQHGNFWEHPVRTVMTTNVHTISPVKIGDAAKIMLRHGIRHLPIISEEKGRKRLVGVISMRDLFRISMEQVNFDIQKLLSVPKPKEKPKTKVIGVLSADPAIAKMVSQSGKLTKHLLVQTTPLERDVMLVAEHLENFDALLVDIDGISNFDWEALLEKRRELNSSMMILVAFNPLTLPERMKKSLQKLAETKKIFLLSKPIPLGLLYEKFLKGL